jgi:hypothetical protein
MTEPAARVERRARVWHSDFVMMTGVGKSSLFQAEMTTWRTCVLPCPVAIMEVRA